MHDLTSNIEPTPVEHFKNTFQKIDDDCLNILQGIDENNNDFSPKKHELLQLASRLGIAETAKRVLSNTEQPESSHLTEEFKCPTADVIPIETEKDRIVKDIQCLQVNNKFPPRFNKPAEFSAGALRALRLSKDFSHLMVQDKRKNICSLCSQGTKFKGKKESSFKCETCGVFLCRNPISANGISCFQAWHEQENLVHEATYRKDLNMSMHSLRSSKDAASLTISSKSSMIPYKIDKTGTIMKEDTTTDKKQCSNLHFPGKTTQGSGTLSLGQDEFELLHSLSVLDKEKQKVENQKQQVEDLIEIIQQNLNQNRLAQGLTGKNLLSHPYREQHMDAPPNKKFRSDAVASQFVKQEIARYPTASALVSSQEPSSLLPNASLNVPMEHLPPTKGEGQEIFTSEGTLEHDDVVCNDDDEGDEQDAENEDKCSKKKRKKKNDNLDEEEKDRGEDGDDDDSDDEGGDYGCPDRAMDDAGSYGSGSDSNDNGDSRSDTNSHGFDDNYANSPGHGSSSKNMNTLAGQDDGDSIQQEKEIAVIESVSEEKNRDGSKGLLQTKCHGKDLYDRLTVFTSAPLVVDHGGTLYPFPLLNFDHERKVLLDAVEEAEQIGGKIDVSFEAATTDRLGACLAAGTMRVLHFSCHGQPKYLAIEDGRGAMQALPVDKLRDFVSSGSNRLQVVFVSACHSLEAGHAFIDAGVPHVICCRQSAKLRDSVASEFAQHFYRSLACGRTLKQSFTLARQAILVSPKCGEPRIEMDKFVLLPEKADDDLYHDIPVFYTHPVQHIVSKDTETSKLLPPPPQLLLGREIDTFRVLQELTMARIVRLTGKAGIGKTALAKAVCQYIGERKRSFFLEDIIWLPDQGMNQSCEFHPLFKSSDHLTDLDLMGLCRKIVRTLYDKRVLIVVDVGAINPPYELEKLKTFFSEIIRGTQYIKMVLVCPSGSDIDPQESCVDVRILLGPISMKSSVLLFGYLCPFVSQQSCPSVHTPSDLLDLLVPESQANATAVSKSMSKRCADIFNTIGGGIPLKVRTAAKSMTEAEYLDLIRLGQRPEFQANIKSRSELEDTISRTQENLATAIRNTDFTQAQSLKDYIEELENLREQHPSVQELETRQSELSNQLNDAIQRNSFTKAADLKRLLDEVTSRLKRENELMLAVYTGTGNTTKRSKLNHTKQHWKSEPVEDGQNLENIAAVLKTLGKHDIETLRAILKDGPEEQITAQIATDMEQTGTSDTSKSQKEIPRPTPIICVSNSIGVAQGNSLSKEEIMDLKELFCEWKFDYDGPITVSQVRQILMKFGQRPRQREWKPISRNLNDTNCKKNTDIEEALMSLLKLSAETEEKEDLDFALDTELFDSIDIARGGVKPSCAYSIRSFHLVVSFGSVVDFSYPNSDRSAIVVATNEGILLKPCDGVGGAVGVAAGNALQEDISNLKKLSQSHWGPILCETGDSKLVGPNKYNDLQVQNVIFAVGPDYSYVHDQGKDMLKQKDAQLRSAYRSALKLAKQAKLEAVAFSLLSTGCRGAREDRARSLRVGMETVCKFSGYSGLKEIHMVAFKPWEVKALLAYSKEMNLEKKSLS